MRRDPDRARECYQRAFAANPHDPRLLAELDQLMARLGESSSARLARLEEHLELVEQRDDLCVARAALCNRTGQPEKTLEIARARQFHPWEGGEGRVSDQYVAACVALGRQALEAGRPGQALEHLADAQHFPENMGEGRHPNAPDAHIHYYTGLACEALEKCEDATENFARAARQQRTLSAMTYYQALALEKLERKEESRQRLQELLDFATQQLETTGRTGFATSIPRFVFEEDDPRKRRQITHTYLLGLAHLGLGNQTEAAQILTRVLELDPNHSEATEELRRIEEKS